LVVEDDEFSQSVYRQVLTKAGYKVVMVGDGNSALRQMHKQRPDLIMMDIMLPEIDGIQTTKLIMQEPRFCGVPIIVVSGHSEKAMVEKAIKAGARDYLVKPITAKRLLDKVKKRLK